MCDQSSIKLRLPAISEPLPDYLAPYIRSDVAELEQLSEAMLQLIQDAEELLEWHKVAKRLESYRFDHLTFSQKFVRFNSTTKNRISDGIYKTYREIGICEKRLQALHDQNETLHNIMLPVAKRNAELREAHRAWPRPDTYPSPAVAAAWDAGPDRAHDEDVDTTELGEGITRRIRKGVPAVNLLPVALCADKHGFYQVHPIAAFSNTDRRNCTCACGLLHKDAIDEFNDDYMWRLQAEIGRLKIARGLMLRELSMARSCGDTDAVQLEGVINSLQTSIITAAQAYYETSINRLHHDLREQECCRLDGLSDFDFASEVLAVAGVASHRLTAGEEERAAAELQSVLRKRVLRAALDGALWNERTSVLDAAMMVVTHISSEEIEEAVKLGPDAIISQIIKLQHIQDQKESALNETKSKYRELSVAQKYVRREDSKTWKALKAERTALSQEVKQLRESILVLKDKFKLTERSTNEKDSTVTDVNIES